MKTLIKRCCCILMAFFMIFLISPKSYADVIAEPFGDEFYEKHVTDMNYINTIFYVNAPDGELAVYKSPEDYTVVTTLENGTTIFVSHEYIDKENHAWCVVDLHLEGITGWVPKEYLYERYSSALFREQYETELSDGVSVDLSSYSTVYLYETPGSSEYYEMFANTDGAFEKFESEFSFVDSEGRTWAYVNYYYGYRDLFIYAEHPDMKPEEVMKDGFSSYDKRGELFPKKETVDESETETVEETETVRNRDDEIHNVTEPDYVIKSRQRKQMVFILVGVLVGITVLASIIILVFILRKKKK